MSQRNSQVLHSFDDLLLDYHLGNVIVEFADEAEDDDWWETREDEYGDRLEREQLEAVESAGGWLPLLFERYVLEQEPYTRKNWMVDRAKLGFENTRKLFARKTYISWVRFLKIRTKRFCYPF